MDNNNLTIKQLKSKYRSEGYNSLSNIEKIRLLLSYSEKEKDIDKTAENIISTYGNIHTIADADSLFLMNVYGISESSTALLKIIPALSNICTFSEYSKLKLNTSENAKKFFHAFLKNNRFEKSVIVAVNKQFSVVNQFTFSSEKADKVDVPFRKVYEFAQNNHADYIFIAHCHPNGSAVPSNSDINVTIRLQGVLSMIDVPLVDHIIVGSDNVLSMREYSDKNIFDDVKKYIINVTTDE